MCLMVFTVSLTVNASSQSLSKDPLHTVEGITYAYDLGDVTNIPDENIDKMLDALCEASNTEEVQGSCTISVTVHAGPVDVTVSKTAATCEEAMRSAINAAKKAIREARKLLM